MRRMNANIIGKAKAAVGGDVTPNSISFTAIGTDYYDNNHTNIQRITGITVGITIAVSYADNFGSFGTNLLSAQVSDYSDMSSPSFVDFEGGAGSFEVQPNQYVQFFYSGFYWSSIQVYLVNTSDSNTALNDFEIIINN